MTNHRSLLHHLHASNLLAWEDMPADLARKVREALADEPATGSLDLTPILHRWGPGPLWEVCTEDGDVDGYVRALCYEDARRAAADMGCDGDYTVAECHEAPHAERLEHAANDIAALLTEVTRLRLLASTPSPAPTASGAEPARVEGASGERRACGTCAHDRRPYCAIVDRGHADPLYSDTFRWACDNTDPGSGDDLPGAKDCPGWAPKSGEVSDG